MTEISVLLPAFGNPTMATSASSFSSSLSQRSCPISPCSANDGARLRFERKLALPPPPDPARLPHRGRPPPVRQEARLAAPPPAARGGQPAVAFVHEVGQHHAV